jgi:hypothetical protein
MPLAHAVRHAAIDFAGHGRTQWRIAHQAKPERAHVLHEIEAL